VNESFITGYKVVVVDKCGRLLRLNSDEPSSLYLVKSTGSFEPSCCTGDAYSITWSLALPEGYSHFMIMAYSDEWGDQDAGALIEIVDAINGTNIAAASGYGLPRRRSVSSGTQHLFAAPIAATAIGLSALIAFVV